MKRSIPFTFALTSLFVTSLAAIGCGSAPPPAPAEPVKEATQERPRGPKMQMQSELGSIDEKGVEATMRRAEKELIRCHRSGLRRIEYLSGDVKFFLRIGQDGRVKYSYFEDSSLGDSETESCILGVLNGETWPKPEGGEAEVRKSFGFDAPGDVRRPTSWPSDKLAPALGKAEDDVKKCRGDVSGQYRVTAYVEPDGKHGKIDAAGIVPPGKDGVDKIECLLKTVKGMKNVPSPGSYAAKVSFVL